ncbi:hypothetical protein E9976_24850 [Salmonella enterica]|nr:hypothetical protein [Salmonella enterica subsp. enterica serovar Hvittingfoss]
MTFRGDLLLCSLGCYLHPFENLRRKGVNERGRQQLSRARFTACHLPWMDDDDCACLSPGERDLNGGNAPGQS